MPVRRIGRRAAIVGAGPADLACAGRLNAAGWTAAVYDRNKRIGGLLATRVPPFKLDKSLLARRETWSEASGVRFDLGIEVDEVLIGELQRKCDILFMGTGAQRPRPMKLPGRDRSGVLEALDLLSAVNADRAPDLRGTRVLVLGGGDTAMDCAGSALRLGAASVSLAYRGLAERLRAALGEIQAAREEGARFLLEHVPLAGYRLKAVVHLKVREAEELAARLSQGSAAVSDRLASIARHMANVRLGAGRGGLRMSGCGRHSLPSHLPHCARSGPME